MASDIGGVWRTIGGRRVFIKDGQSLHDAMKESGKFNKKQKEEEFEKNIDEMYNRFHGKTDKEIAEEIAKERGERLLTDEEQKQREVQFMKNLEKEPATYFEGKKDIENEVKQIYAEEGIRATSEENLKYISEKYGIPKTQAKAFIEDTAKRFDEENERKNKEYKVDYDKRPTSDVDRENQKNNKITEKIEKGQKTFDPVEFEKWRQEEDSRLEMDDDRARSVYESLGQPKAKKNQDSESKYKEYYKKENLGKPSNYQKGDKVTYTNSYGETIHGTIVREADEGEKQFQINKNLKGYIIKDSNGDNHIVVDTRIKLGNTTREKQKVSKDTNSAMNQYIRNEKQKKAYKKYLKEHPNSELSFNEFKDLK